MYFVGMRGLASAIAAGALTPPIAARYLVGFLLVGAAPLLVFVPYDKSVLVTALRSSAVLLITSLGVAYCYKRNRVLPEFASRFLAVGFVVGVRLHLYVVLFGIAVLFAGLVASLGFHVNVRELLGPLPSADTTRGVLFFTSFSLLWRVFYFWRVGVHLGRIPASPERAA